MKGNEEKRSALALLGDSLKVHSWRDRIVVDLDPDERNEHYLAIDMNGGLIRMGMEKQVIPWAAVIQLRKVLQLAEDVFIKEEVGDDEGGNGTNLCS